MAVAAGTLVFLNIHEDPDKRHARAAQEIVRAANLHTRGTGPCGFPFRRLRISVRTLQLSIE